MRLRITKLNVKCKLTQSVQMSKTERYKKWGAMMKKSMMLIWWPKNLQMPFNCYKAEILRQYAHNNQDPSMNKAMMAITRNMNKSIRCTPLTLQNQMHNFAVGTVGKSRSKRGGVIKVNPPSLARRTFKVPGKGPAPLGGPVKNRAGQTQMFVTDDEDILAYSDKVFVPQLKKPHNLAKTVKRNESAPNRHTKQ